MAESLCFLLIEKLTSALAEEAINQVGFLLVRAGTVLTQVRSRMNQIKSEFEVIQSFLSYIGPTKENDRLLEAWVKQVRDVAFAVEDAIDIYRYLLAERQTRKTSFPKKLIRKPSIATAWNDMADELDEILNRLRHLRDMKERYGIKINRNDGLSIAVENRNNYIDGQEFVGREMEKKRLIRWLVDNEEADSKVISVWGMVGLGKTTLVSDVYRDNKIKAHFDCCAWVTFSQTSRVDGILRRIVREFFREKEGKIPQHIDSLEQEKLTEILECYLKEMKYLIVLDDLSATDVWNELRSILLDNKHASRIVLTTRNGNVASLAAKVMKLNKLSEENSWTLFCNKAFWNDKEKTCPAAVESKAKELLEKCEGVPLAIVSIGNYLSLIEKKDMQWNKVLEDMSWLLNSTPELGLMKRIWTLSLHRLPDFLKNCLLYCGIFPEDYPIKRKRLIRLWVAEGFIKERGNRSMEDVAEEYLNDLVRTCMLQVTERNDFGRVRSCKMNKILRDLAVSMSDEEDFYSIRGTADTDLWKSCRRLSVHRTGDNAYFDGKTTLKLRTFIHFDTVIFPINQFRFKLLRVLDVQGTPLQSLPKDVFDLFNLNYLGLRKTKISTISKSIKKLINLQTLDLAYTQINFLPESITELKKLRHLFVHTIGDQTHKSFRDISGFPAPEKIWDLKRMQTLQGIEAGSELVKNLKSMTQLRTFRIMKVRAIHCKDLSDAITRMNQLHRLDIVAAEEYESLDMKDMKIPPSCLEKLTFRARLEALPLSVGSLNNLTWLRLCWSALTEDPLPSISKLPNLVFLLLTKAYNGPELVFRNGWFPKLKDLRLSDMDNLQKLEIEEQSLSKLRQLNLVRCGKLKEVSQGIWNLKKLEMLYLEETPKKFVESLRSRSPTKDGALRRQKSEDPEITAPASFQIMHVFQEDGKWYGQSLRDPNLPYHEEYIEKLKEEMNNKEDS